MAESESEDAPRTTSRRPAIVTYEKVEALATTLAEVETLLRTTLKHHDDRFASGSRTMEDLGTRMRTLELQVGIVMASSTQSKNQWQWVWQALINLVTVGTAVAALFFSKH